MSTPAPRPDELDPDRVLGAPSAHSLREYRRRREEQVRGTAAGLEAGAAEEDRRAAAALDRLLADRVAIVVHDRARPGSAARIDHLAVGPGGVTVVDTKRLAGPIRVSEEGFFRPRRELRVDGRPRMELVSAVGAHVDIVRGVLEAHGLFRLEVRGALLFVDADLPLFGLRDVQGILLGPPRKVAKLARRPGELTRLGVAGIAERLALAFPAS